MDFGGIGEQAGFLVDDQRTFFPAVPAAQHDFHELIGAVVAQIVLHVDGAAHIVRFAVVHRRDDVPGGASAQHVVDGLKAAGDVEGLIVSGGGGRSDAEVFRSESHGHHGGDRV